MRTELEIKTWRDYALGPASRLAWRAQVYAGRKTAMSAIGLGETPELARDDARRLYRQQQERLAEAAASVSWQLL